MSPLVSILMPAYNAENYVSEAIESILNQTLTDLELIIINDGSKDETLKVINGYIQQDNRIIVISRENGGISAALNDGLAIAKGKYIARMDADDISLPQRLEKQVRYMETHQEIGISGAWIKTFGNKGSSIWEYFEDDKKARSWLIFGANVLHSVVIMRNEILQKNNLKYESEYDLAEDYRLWICASKFTNFGNIPEVLLLVRQSSTSSTSEYYSEYYNKTAILSSLLLKDINITPTQVELDIHMSLRHGTFLSTKEYLTKVDSWLTKIHYQNAHYRKFSESEFSEILSERWFKACYFSTENGLSTLKSYFFSPLRRYSKISFKVKLKFVLKCLIRRKVMAKQSDYLNYIKRLIGLS